MSRIALKDIPSASSFVKRSLAAMMPAAEEDDRAAYFSELCAEPWTKEKMEAALAGIADPTALGTALRKMRREVVVNLVGRNASGLCGYDEVVEAMTAFAETAVSSTVSAHARALAERHGVPHGASGRPQDLLAVGMGKLGGRELNVSSDIDLIFIYSEDGETRPTEEFPKAARTLDNAEFFSRLARRVIPALNEIEGPGFVFRVDMRLRPNGDAGPIVCSSDMLEEYLCVQGRDWERFAWIKGRVVNRPVFMNETDFEAASREIGSIVKPFVFRKYLDFGAISSLTKLHEMIRAETNRREAVRGRDGVNVKLGRGGIREIEFIVQTQQVIRGGRTTRLRGRSTLAMLDALAEEGVLTAEAAERLKRGYVFLRNVEHALQYVDDRQTQWLPREGEALEAAAALLGMTPADLWTAANDVREFVADAFDGIFKVNEAKAETKDDAWPVGWATGTSTARAALAEKLGQLGYGSAAGELAARVTALVSGRCASMVSEEARVRMCRLVQYVAEMCPQWSGGGIARIVPAAEALSRYLRLLEAVAGRSTYIALLYQYPHAAERVGRVLSASRWSADYLARHPIVLDELVDARNAEMDDYTPVDWSGWTQKLRESLLESEGDQERQMNLLRDAHHAALFRLLIADLDGRFTVERLADQLSALADAAIQEAIELAWKSISRKHAERPKFAVVGYGKLGGKELSYASDLDLVFVHDDPSPDADGVYSRLVRRMMSWLTVQTSSGKLFDVDLRLRPNGESGLAVTSFDMLDRYQKNADGGAWLWEHQALTRARYVAGDRDVGRKFEAMRAEVLRMPRDKAALREGILKMRAKMLEGRPSKSAEMFDLKHDRGGMVDLEFMVQYFVLAESGAHPGLVNNFGNILLMEMCADLGLADPELAVPAVAAYRRFRALQHEIRLNAGEGASALVSNDSAAAGRDAILALWRAVFETDEPQRGSAFSREAAKDGSLGRLRAAL